MLEAQKPEFKEYVIQLKKNSSAFCAALVQLGHKIVTGGTDNHLFLWDLRPFELSGSKMEKACDLIHITVNKNMIAGDTSALTPGGVRIGTPAMTSRGMKEEDFVAIAKILDKLTQVCRKIQETTGKKLTDFLPVLEKAPELDGLRKKVNQLASKLGIPGF